MARYPKIQNTNVHWHTLDASSWALSIVCAPVGYLFVLVNVAYSELHLIHYISLPASLPIPWTQTRRWGVTTYRCDRICPQVITGDCDKVLSILNRNVYLASVYLSISLPVEPSISLLMHLCIIYGFRLSNRQAVLPWSFLSVYLSI